MKRDLNVSITNYEENRGQRKSRKYNFYNKKINDIFNNDSKALFHKYSFGDGTKQLKFYGREFVSVYEKYYYCLKLMEITLKSCYSGDDFIFKFHEDMIILKLIYLNILIILRDKGIAFSATTKNVNIIWDIEFSNLQHELNYIYELYNMSFFKRLFITFKSMVVS